MVWILLDTWQILILHNPWFEVKSPPFHLIRCTENFIIKLYSCSGFMQPSSLSAVRQIPPLIKSTTRRCHAFRTVRSYSFQFLERTWSVEVILNLTRTWRGQEECRVLSSSEYFLQLSDLLCRSGPGRLWPSLVTVMKQNCPLLQRVEGGVRHQNLTIICSSELGEELW